MICPSEMTKRSQSRSLIVVASAGLLALGALALVGQGDSDTDRTADSGGLLSIFGGPSRRSANSASGPCSFASGVRMAYDVRTSSQKRLDMSPLMGAVQLNGTSQKPQAQAVDQKGSRQWHLDLEAIAGSPDGSTVLAAHIEGGALERPGASTVDAGPGLADTFLVRVGPRCDVREFGWRTDGDLGTAKTQQQLVAGLSWLAPRERASAWNGALLDALGRYHASFAREDDRVRGRIVEFDETFGSSQSAAGAQADFEVLESAVEIEPLDGHWFQSLSSAHSLQMTMRGTPVGNVDYSVVAQRAEPSDWAPEVSASDEGWSWGLLLGRPSGTKDRTMIDSRLAGVAPGEAVQQYLAMVHDRRSLTESVGMLTEWLRANPEGAADLVDLLRQGAFDGTNNGRPGLFLALGRAQTPQAARALVGILEGPSDAMRHKISASLALSSIESPTEAMVDAVVAVVEQADISPEARGSLQMTLGAFANRNAERSPELAAKAREQISGWLSEPSDDKELASSLLAAGNTADDAMVPAIAPYLEHDDPEIRERASHAMRHMSPEEAYPRLEERMSDQSMGVRASAIETLTRVSRKNRVAPPESAVNAAIAQLDTGVAHERDALLGLLGAASDQGNAEAAAVLRQKYEAELNGGRNAKRLQSLGRHTRTRWVAP